MEGGQVHAALRSLRGIYDPRNLPAGQELAITAATRDNQPAHLISVAFDLNFDHQLLITRDADGGFTTKKVEQAKAPGAGSSGRRDQDQPLSVSPASTDPQ